MLETVFKKFHNGCLMVFRRDTDTVLFLGSAFLVHSGGYLLTVSHILPSEGQLMVVSGETMSNEFTPISQEMVASIPVSIVRRNRERDVALLKMEVEIDMSLPDFFLGSAENIPIGSSVMAMGYAFGHQSLHTLVAMNAVVSARMISPNNSRLLLFDSMMHDGDRGGPLVGVSEGVVVGIISGRFDPREAARDITDDSRTVETNTNISYAVAIEYGLELMEEEGLLETRTTLGE
ncbi:S1 family peptidase [Desulfopila inferna]|uniref:S1 family peptidase n=1 Tax=Desulfopila inferna TaxID=468528 RepID=UPI00196678E5|nr:serine protease [Desulfopila inferna]MBM9603904.1 trypsin-like peptidase domain-containing protein [Desulfopila inferna]